MSGSKNYHENTSLITHENRNHFSIYSEDEEDGLEETKSPSPPLMKLSLPFPVVTWPCIGISLLFSAILTGTAYLLPFSKSHIHTTPSNTNLPPKNIITNLHIPHLTNLYLKSTSTSRYFRVYTGNTKLETEKAIKDSLYASEVIPWLHGSLLQLHWIVDSSALQTCFHLKSLKNSHWLRRGSYSSSGDSGSIGGSSSPSSYYNLDNEHILMANSVYNWQAEAFSFMTIDNNNGSTESASATAVTTLSSSSLSQVRLIPCLSYIASSSDIAAVAAATVATDPIKATNLLMQHFHHYIHNLLNNSFMMLSTPFPLTNIITTKLHQQKLSKESSSLRSSSNSNNNRQLAHQTVQPVVQQAMQYEPEILAVEIQPMFRGVNLGGWFIPEVWMNPSFYSDTGLGWTGSLCRMYNYSASLTEDRMANHLATWITAADFAEMAALEYTSLRVPIGYWNILAYDSLFPAVTDGQHEQQHKMGFAPANITVSDTYLTFIFEQATLYNFSILLDLHGLPGSQNAIDHSGCNMPYQALWHLPENVNKSLVVLEALLEKYGHQPQLIGIELMNEPSHSYSLEKYNLLIKFYKQAYSLLRAKSSTLYMIINELYTESYNKYSQELQEPFYYNVIMDYHLYNWQLPYTYETYTQHLKDANDFTFLLNDYQSSHPIIIGEWCMSTGIYLEVGQPFVDACVSSFEEGGSLGWYLWNWKIEPQEVKELQQVAAAAGSPSSSTSKEYKFQYWDVQRQGQLMQTGQFQLQSANGQAASDAVIVKQVPGLDPFHIYKVKEKQRQEILAKLQQ